MSEATEASCVSEEPGAAVFTALPDGLSSVAAGPVLGALLASVDRALLNGYQLVELVQARHRQVCWEQAQLLADAHELAYARTGAPGAVASRSVQRDPHAGDELAFALAWSGWAADDTLTLAYLLHTTLPAVYTALEQGRIDVAKAKLIVREVDLLCPEQARAVVDAVLDGVEFRSPGVLREMIRRLVLAIDPDLVRKRHKKALADRNVSAETFANGTAMITGRFLPKDKVAAAMDYLSRMALATKNAGDRNGTGFDERDRRSLDQIRADIFCDLLAGVDPSVSAADGGAGAVNPAPRKGVVNLTVDLTTLLCLDEHPGELAGFGPVVADMARQVTQRLLDDTVWRFTVTHDGRIVHEHRLHYRPTVDQAAYVRARDKHCRAPGCRRPTHQCDIDHVTAWEDHGVTHEDNLCVACRRHHRAKHGGFTLYRTDFGLLWVSPRGHAYPVTFGGRELDTTQRRMLQDIVNRGETTTIFHSRR